MKIAVGIRFYKLAAVSMLLVISSGCYGRDFVRSNSDSFQLGHTTYSEVIQKMGKPTRVWDDLRNEKPVKVFMYFYSSDFAGPPLEEGVSPSRSMTYFFHNQFLVGQEFDSSFKSDNSNFDDTQIERIKKGQTTLAEVIQMLGEPTGLYAPPMVKEKTIGYSYFTSFVSRNPKYSNKKLLVSFDVNRVVLDVEYTTTEGK